MNTIIQCLRQLANVHQMLGMILYMTNTELSLAVLDQNYYIHIHLKLCAARH